VRLKGNAHTPDFARDAGVLRRMRDSNPQGLSPGSFQATYLQYPTIHYNALPLNYQQFSISRVLLREATGRPFSTSSVPRVCHCSIFEIIKLTFCKIR